MIDALIERMKELLEPMESASDPKRVFHATYLRTTIAVAEEIKRPGGFADPEWTERWDVAFADLYLEALEQVRAGEQPSRPWAVAFGARRPACPEPAAARHERAHQLRPAAGSAGGDRG